MSDDERSESQPSTFYGPDPDVTPYRFSIRREVSRWKLLRPRWVDFFCEEDAAQVDEEFERVRQPSFPFDDATHARDLALLLTAKLDEFERRIGNNIVIGRKAQLFSIETHGPFYSGEFEVEGINGRVRATWAKKEGAIGAAAGAAGDLAAAVGAAAGAAAGDLAAADVLTFDRAALGGFFLVQGDKHILLTTLEVTRQHRSLQHAHKDVDDDAPESAAEMLVREQQARALVTAAAAKNVTDSSARKEGVVIVPTRPSEK